MNRALRIILVVYLVTVAACCLYVPWVEMQGPGQRETLGYHPLWAHGRGAGYGTVDLECVFLELLAASALAGAAVVLVGTKAST